VPLTRKQKWRIDKVQSDKIARADKAASKAESELDDEKEYQGIVITRYGQRQLVEDENGIVFQSCKQTKHWVLCCRRQGSFSKNKTR
jgi:ribosome biogenesis GTPase